MHIVKASQIDYIPASHESPQNPGVVKKVLARSGQLAQGTIQMINWALLPVGKAFEAHYHEDMQEVFIIVAGTAEITIDRETATLETGDLVLIPSRAVHVMKNTGNTNVEYIALGISKSGTGKTINV
jgi:mannose-6-phosphate isomerase-like protein (cupin superfamily)